MMGNEGKGLLLGLLGVSLFALTLPLTKILVLEIGVYETTFLRSTFTGLIAIGFLFFSKAAFPSKASWYPLILIIISIGLGFPIGTAFAMQYLPPGQGGIVLGLTPLLTAIIGARLSKQSPSKSFWIAATFGFLIITIYSLSKNNWQISKGDLGLLIASISAATGYSQAGRLAKTMGSKNIISWVMAIALVFNFPITLYFLDSHAAEIMTNLLLPAPLSAFILLSVVTMYIANFFWYDGLSLGGIAKVGQMLLLQPLITLFIAGLLLNEPVGIIDYCVCLSLIVIILYCQMTPMRSQTT